MYEIGQMWADLKLDVATEHVCSNIAHSLVKVINERYAKHGYQNKKKKYKVFICTPSGELHNLACNIIESVLLTRGYKVYNASPSLPAESVLGPLKEIKPDVIMISVTLHEHIEVCKRLVRKIKGALYHVPIIVGGIATNDIHDTNLDAIIVRNGSLDETVKLLKSIKVYSSVE